MNVECNTCLQIIRRNDIEGGLMDIDNESDDDESVVEDDITCKHDLVNGKVVVCCKFVVNSDEILDIIHNCSFECTYETDSKLMELEETLMYYICEKNEHSSNIVESVKSTISSHHKKLLDELHNIMYNEFVSSVQNQYYCDYYEKPAVNRVTMSVRLHQRFHPLVRCISIQVITKRIWIQKTILNMLL